MLAKMSGNPFGLAEISHYGGMQRVGGKAGGFINKKFFHPSSLRNQEKLWKAQTADAMENARQRDREKQREEERKVEQLRKDMYLAGQSGGSDLLFRGTADGDGPANGGKRSEKVKYFEEQKRRRVMVKDAQAARADRDGVPEGQHGKDEEDDDVAIVGEVLKGEAVGAGVKVEDAAEAPEAPEAPEDLPPAPTPRALPRVMVKSRYEEDVHVRGHTSVWGSWYTTEGRQWGFSCCKSAEHSERGASSRRKITWSPSARSGSAESAEMHGAASARAAAPPLVRLIARETMHQALAPVLLLALAPAPALPQGRTLLLVRQLPREAP